MSKRIENTGCPRNYGELHSISSIEGVYEKSSQGDSILISKILIYHSLKSNLDKICKLDNLGGSSLLKKRVDWIYFFSTFLRELNAIFKDDTEKNSIFFPQLINSQSSFSKSLKLFDQKILDYFVSQNGTKTIDADVVHKLKLFISSIPYIVSEQESADTFKNIKAPNGINLLELYRDSTIGELDFLLEFRMIHQIQEFLFNDVNKLLHNGISNINKNEYALCSVNLMDANELLQLTFKANYGLLDCLSVEDYYSFRNSLGQSSGIQSKAICTTNFRKLYPKFSGLVVSFIESKESMDSSADFNLMIKQAFKLSNNIHTWKEIHLLFPANYLGGNYNGYGTSSMLGLKDGLETVIKLLNKGYKSDPLIKYYKPNRTVVDNSISSDLIAYLLKKTGQETQSKFPEVQNKAHDK